MDDNITPIFQLKNVVTDNEFNFKKPINLKLLANENWIIYGPNGSGKTFLINTIRGAYRLRQGEIIYNFKKQPNASKHTNIKYVTFLDQYASNIISLPYQMRWNYGTLDLTFEAFVKDFFNDIKKLPAEFTNVAFKEFKIEQFIDQTIQSLSSGEFRRFQLLQVLTKRPQVLIIDNPFIGLDEQGRETISNLLNLATAYLNINIILVVSKIPQNTTGFTHLILIKDNEIKKISISEISTFNIIKAHKTKTPELTIARKSTQHNAPIILQANNINISYGGKNIFKDFNLTIRQGECWALTGSNGSGKSTLLSLICADNPQAYACDISLFGRKRGSGESIWDIKKNIGFVSPEMYRSYRRNLPTIDIIATGLYDTTGLFKHIKENDHKKVEKWIDIFGIQDLKNKNYLSLSSGQQRLALLCRAFVKEPMLLILDEPFHGLDDINVNKAREIITQYISQKPERTLIMVSHYKTDFPHIIDHTLELKKNYSKFLYTKV